MDISQASFESDIGVEIILRTRTLNTHSRMQQLSEADLNKLDTELRKIAAKFVILIKESTKSPTA